MRFKEMPPPSSGLYRLLWSVWYGTRDQLWMRAFLVLSDWFWLMSVPLNLFMIISQSISQSLLQRQQPETANINIIPPSATELFEGQIFSVLLDTIFTQTQIQRGYTHILDAVAEVHTPLAALSLASNKWLTQQRKLISIILIHENQVCRWNKILHSFAHLPPYNPLSSRSKESLLWWDNMLFPHPLKVANVSKCLALW